MPYYRCSVINPAGKKTSLIKEAADEHDLAVSFNDEDHILIKYTQIADADIIRSKRNYNRDIVLEFTQIMTSLLKSGLNIQDAVSLCGSISANPKTCWLCKSLLRALRNGLPLYEAVRMHSPSFPPLYRSLVKLGEQTGSVAAVFQRMGVYLLNEKKIRGKIGNVIWYPSLVLTIALAGSIGIIAFIFPRMNDIYSAFRAGTGQDASVEIGHIYRSMWGSAAFIGVIAASVIFFFLLRKYSARFAYFSDYLFLNMPLFGGYIKAIQTMDFSFAMEMLTGSGINVHTALRETAAVIRNRAYAKALVQVHSHLLKGERLSSAFGAYGEFPPYIATWIAVGERTGGVEPVFTQIREYFQADVDRMSERLMNMLEPCLILIAGSIVLIMILQLILPLFSLYGRLL
jgi:type II secretory pathway component PulF